MSREKVYVVDENDKVIGEKFRDETSPYDRIRIVCIWLKNSAGQLLIAKRSKNFDSHAGLWGPSAAGGVTVGESYYESAKKELFEELGLNLDKEIVSLVQITKRPYGKTDDGGGLRMMAVFEAKIEWTIDRFNIQEEEVSEIKWVLKKDFIQDLQDHPDVYLPNADTWTSEII